MESYEIKSEVAYFLHFMPMSYLHDTIIPATNATASASISEWEEINIEQMLHVFGILLGMGMYGLPERHMYWKQIGHLYGVSLVWNRHVGEDFFS